MHLRAYEKQQQKPSQRNEENSLESETKQSLKSLNSLACCLRACGNVPCTDVSNEECWAALIHQGWEWAVKSYQSSRSSTFSCAQLSLWGANPPEENATEQLWCLQRVNIWLLEELWTIKNIGLNHNKQRKTIYPQGPRQRVSNWESKEIEPYLLRNVWFVLSNRNESQNTIRGYKKRSTLKPGASKSVYFNWCLLYCP